MPMGFEGILWLVVNVRFLLSTISHLISHFEHHHFVFPQSIESLNDGKMGKLIMACLIQVSDVGTCNFELLTQLLK